MLPAEPLVVAENAVVGQGEGSIPSISGEGMVVCIESLAALSGHARVAHDEVGVLIDLEPEQVCRQGPLVDFQTAAGVVGDAGGIGAPLFTRHRQNGQDFSFFLAAQLVTVVKDSEQTAQTHTS